MKLKDTIKLMESDDYKDRFKAEYYQLKIRKEKLQKMLNNKPFHSKDFLWLFSTWRYEVIYDIIRT